MQLKHLDITLIEKCQNRSRMSRIASALRQCEVKTLQHGKRTPTSVRRRSSWVDFRLRNPSSLDVVFVMKALFGKHTPTSVRRRSSRVDFRLRNPSSPDVVFVMKALFSILDPQNRVETNTCFVFAHDFVLGVRYCFFFFVAYLYYRLHKIFAMPPFHGWPITTTT